MNEHMKRIYYPLVIALSLGLASCDKFLDQNPDKRASIDTIEDVNYLLSSAYTEHCYATLTELMSDNVDDFHLTQFNKTNRFFDEVFAWKDVTESNNESPEALWGDYWKTITTANTALESLEKMGPESDPALRESYGEAYIVRAYGHFTLVNLFCLQYNPKTCESDPGIPYRMTLPEGFNVKYERESVAEVYRRIEQDLEKGLALVGDTHLKVPKYHFNTSAAYAFATRFYLYYGKYDRAIECADRVLGSNPRSVLKDWDYLASLPSGDAGKPFHTTGYVDSKSPANLLIQTVYSVLYSFWLNYSTYSRYSHGSYLASTETLKAKQPWGSAEWKDGTHTYEGSMDKVIFWRVPYVFQTTNPVAKTGYSRSIVVNFTTDGTLIDRAEAHILKGEYQAACDDLNLWLHNISKSTYEFTPEKVKTYFEGLKYSTWKNGTNRKKLNPVFMEMDESDPNLESMLQLVLHIRRMDNIGFGLRWFDLKRYGITVYRREIDVLESGYNPVSASDSLKVGDPRWAMQIPYKVIQAGFEPNPR